MAYGFTKEQVLKAIDGSFGIMSQIARALGGCAWSTAEQYVNRWAETRQAYQDAQEAALDFTEGQMLAQIKAGDGPMIRFHLATKGKRRGYVTRQELSGEDGGPLELVVRRDRDGNLRSAPAEDAAP